MKTTNVLLGVLVVALIVFGVGFLVMKKTPTEVSPDTNTVSTYGNYGIQQPVNTKIDQGKTEPAPVQNTTIQNTTTSSPTPAGSTVFSSGTMSITAPSNYVKDTTTAHVYGNSVSTLTVGTKNSSISILKYNNQAMFNEDTDDLNASTSSMYMISGIPGYYYANIDGEGQIVVPSKLVRILINPATFSGSEQILASIKL